MKRLISLFAVVIFMTGMVVAQNNVSTTTQEGDENEATVNQQGSQHESVIDQFSASYGGGNIAEVDQNSGEQNYSFIKQGDKAWNVGDDEEAYVTQNGSFNESRLNQGNGPNVAHIDQVGDNNILGDYYSGLSSPAVQKNGGIDYTDANWMDVDQLGDNNKVGINQHHHSEATILQNGNENETYVRQRGPSFGVINTTEVEINGNENITEVYQEGDGNGAYMEVGDPSYVSEMNDVLMNQFGNGNYATFGLQHGDENVVEIDQNGNNNYTNYSIEYGNKNEATYDVDGDANRSRFYVDADWTDWSNGNTLELTQDGYQNYATGIIKGDDNNVTMIQEGNKNLIGNDWWTSDGVNIHGNNNTVNIEQFGNGNKSLNTVTGNGNTIDVVQQH